MVKIKKDSIGLPVAGVVMRYGAPEFNKEARIEVSEDFLKTIIDNQKVVYDLENINEFICDKIDDSVYCNMDFKGLAKEFQLGNFKTVNGYWFILLHYIKLGIEAEQKNEQNG